MANGIGENRVRSPAYVAQLVDYPITRDDLVEAAGDAEAPLEVINFFKSLPADRYESYEQVLRDFAEAERRFADGAARHGQGHTRENLGRTSADDAPGTKRHP